MPKCPACGHELEAEFAFCPHCGAPLTASAPAREQRKTVTVLFCDVIGSTTLGESTDPEALRTLLAHYFTRMKAIVEGHGGTVEKFIGDAVMAIFGVPQIHEDDALRACRAAVEMRDALPELGVQARIGINTGEVVTGTSERIATGDAVNVAARLEQAAPPGAILVGERTLALVHHAVEVEPVEPLELKGKSNPVGAYRLIGMSAQPARRHDTPMVGRRTELRRLGDAYEQAVRDHSCQLFTILGSAGVGKSRLVSDFLDSVDATVVRGRCLPYGEGITYWPVVEVIKELPEWDIDPPTRRVLASVLGEDAAAVTSADEIAWAFRKLLETAARKRPLVCVFDDIQWGEETFLDLVEHVADLSREAPILLLCMARPDLLDRRPGWAGGKLNATNILLEPLSTDETKDLIATLAADLADEIRGRVVAAAEGNPLFVEEMVELARAADGGEVTVPPTIQALLAARLDQLEPSERGVLERGAVEGRVFHRAAVQALAPDEAQIPSRLTALVRKELIRPDSAQIPGEDAFRFRHLLIRDAAYDALPKAERAELHVRFAEWMEKRGAALVELDEIIGYHLEQAVRYRLELALPSDPGLSAKARARLTQAGHRARVRGDEPGAASLLERAASLVPAGEIDLALEAELLDALFWSGRGDEAVARAASLTDRAAAAGAPIAELSAKIRHALYRTFQEPEGMTDELGRLIAQALPVLEAASDDIALYIAYEAAARVANMHALADVALEAFERADVHASRVNIGRGFDGWIALCRIEGATPIPEALEWIDQQGVHPSAHVRENRARALAMLGRFSEARATVAELSRELANRGDRRTLANMLGFGRIEVELLAGDPSAAVEAGLEACPDVRGAGRSEHLLDRGWPARRCALCRGSRGRGGCLGRPRSRTWRERRRVHAALVAPGTGESARESRRAAGGRTVCARGGRHRRRDRLHQRPGQCLRLSGRGALAGRQDSGSARGARTSVGALQAQGQRGDARAGPEAVDVPERIDTRLGRLALDAQYRRSWGVPPRGGDQAPGRTGPRASRMRSSPNSNSSA